MPFYFSDDAPLLPPPPFSAIEPPKDIAQRDRTKVVYGFPISREWIQFRLYHDVEVPAKVEGREPESEAYHFERLLIRLTLLCDRMVVIKCYPTVVETGTRKLRAFLVVGRPGRKPSPEQLEKLVDQLAEYGIVEHPGWYSKA